jgi:hypothetical protein
MNDSSASSSKDAPKTFAERGAAVPFTTTELMFARMRQKGETKELLVPGLAQTRGIYVYEWASMRNRFQLSLHDRLLHFQLTIAPAPTPAALSAVSLKVALGGSAGGEVLAGAEETMRHNETLPVLARFALTQKIIERLSEGGVVITNEEMATEDGQRRATDQLSQIAHVYGINGQQLYGRIETLSTILGPVGVPGMTTETPARRLTRRLELLGKILEKWAGTSGDSDAEAVMVSRVALETARYATNCFSNLDAETGAVDVLLAAWNERIDELKARAERALWLLDGWERLVTAWQNVSTKDRSLQAKCLTLMSFVMPMVPTNEVAADERPAWEDMNAELTKLIAANEEGVDIETMLEVLGPQANQPPGLGSSSRAKPRRGGLSSQKLVQVVRLLESVMERPDGAPARKMLDELRPQIVHYKPPRLPRARRLVCAVFEEMLIDGETESRTAARIPRSAIMPVWALFVERADKARLAQLEQELNKPASVAELRTMFAATLQPELDDAAAFPSKARNLMARLGAESHYHAMQLMVGASAIAEQLMRLRAVLPPSPIEDFKDPDLDRLAEVLNDIRKAAPEQIQMALFIVMGQMSQPFKISNVLEILANSGRFKSSAGISGFVTAAMIGKLEGQVQDVRKLIDAVPGADNAAPTTPIGEAAMALAETIGQCADNFAGTGSALAVNGSPTQTEEVEMMRTKLCDLVGAKLAGSGVGALISALTGAPATITPTGARPSVRWPFDQPPDPAFVRNAELYAQALKRSEASAVTLGIGDKIGGAVQETIDEFEKVATVLFSQMQKANLDRIKRQYATAHVAVLSRVLEILAGTDRAERLFKRGNELVG